MLEKVKKNINRYFDMARDNPRCLYFFFIDEADELLKTRSIDDRSLSNNIVNEFLKRMDTMEIIISSFS